MHSGEELEYERAVQRLRRTLQRQTVKDTIALVVVSLFAAVLLLLSCER